MHAASVNAKNLVVPMVFYEALVSEQVLQPLSLLRHYLLLSQYTEEKCIHRPKDPPGPHSSRRPP